MIEGDDGASRDGVVVPRRRVTRGPHEHRRGVLEGLVAAVVLVLLAAAAGLFGHTPAVSGPSPSNAAVAPAATGQAVTVASAGPTSPAFASLPTIGVGVDHVLAGLLHAGQNSPTAIGDRLIVGFDEHDPSLGQPFAYDPETGESFLLNPEPTSYTPAFTQGSVVVGTLTQGTGAGAGTVATGLVIDDLDTGSNRIVWPKPGYEQLDMFGLAEGYAFGQMVRLKGGLALESRAVVVNLATGQLRDLTPPGFTGSGLAQVHGLARGRALVVLLPGDAPGSRSVDGLELVDLSTGSRSTPAIAPAELGFGAVSETGNLAELRLEGDDIVGHMRDAPEAPLDAFAYRISTGSFQVVPASPPAATTSCPYELDAGRLVCAQSADDPASGTRVFVYDLNRHTTTEVPTPGLTGAVVVVGAANEQVVVQEIDAVPSAPVVWDARSRLVYRLESGIGLPPVQLALVGHLVVDPANGEVWRLP